MVKLDPQGFQQCLIEVFKLNELDILFQILYVPPTIERYLDPNTFLVEEYSYERDPVIKNPKFIIRGVFKEGIPVEKEYLSY